MDKLIDLQGLRKRAELVGYAIRKDYRSSIHGLVAYATLPTKEGGGAINCFGIDNFGYRHFFCLCCILFFCYSVIEIRTKVKKGYTHEATDCINTGARELAAG